MGTYGDGDGVEAGLDLEAELHEIEMRLRWLAGELIERAQTPSPDAVELFTRGTELQRAAFVISAAVVPVLRVA